jgi:hypothetical protein
MCVAALATQPVPMHGDRRAHEADHVVDGVARFHVAAGRRDQHVDRRVGILRQQDQAFAHGARQLVVDLAEHEHEARLEGQLLGQARGLVGLVVLGGLVVGSGVEGGHGVHSCEPRLSQNSRKGTSR